MTRKINYCNIQLQENIKIPLMKYCQQHDLKISFVCGLLVKEFLSGSLNRVSEIYIPDTKI